MILHCDPCATSWDTDDPNQDRRCVHSHELEQRAKLPDGFEPGCSNWHCICWKPGAVCEEFMGYSRYRYCPRCGWTRELHKTEPKTMTTKEPVGVHRAVAAQAFGIPIPCGTPYDCGNAAMTVRYMPRLGGNVHMCEPCAATHDEADTE